MSGNVSRVMDMGNLQEVLLANLKATDLDGKIKIKSNFKNWNVRTLAGFICDIHKNVQWRVHVGQ